MTRIKLRRSLTVSVLAMLAGLPPFAPLKAADITPDATASGASPITGPSSGIRRGRSTGFPIPRFVSIKSNKAYMRVGPSMDYATKWVYSARGLPMEIIEEYGNWRQVRDQDGVTGWMLAPLLSGQRTAVVGPWYKKPVPLHYSPSRTSGIAAELAPKVRLYLKHCDGSWCDVSLQTQDLGGYVAQAALWGVYPQERID
ncbi:SH3 domain-containing protein [Neorhizobium sp. NCHU2750]|uniref:SH3 domain-containing protein n=1 Tax=Neorhizobium sp. NCHU2750 TaxID=1825976 RepID=UPI000E762F16|nr:aspartyl-tRNA synthetase [Neorhizobium sp. NCHU2750]